MDFLNIYLFTLYIQQCVLILEWNTGVLILRTEEVKNRAICGWCCPAFFIRALHILIFYFKCVLGMIKEFYLISSDFLQPLPLPVYNHSFHSRQHHSIKPLCQYLQHLSFLSLWNFSFSLSTPTHSLFPTSLPLNYLIPTLQPLIHSL